MDHKGYIGQSDHLIVRLVLWGYQAGKGGIVLLFGVRPWYKWWLSNRKGGTFTYLGDRTIRFGVLPSSQQLKNAGIQVKNVSEIQLNTEVQLPKIDSRAVQDKPPERKSWLFLATPGLPTVPMKLAQQTCNLDFVEMEEFLPSNRTIQALKVLGVMKDRTVFQIPLACRVADISI